MTYSKNIDEALAVILKLRTPDEKLPIDPTLIPNLTMRLDDLAERDWVNEIPFGKAVIKRLSTWTYYVCDVITETPERILRYRTIGPKKMEVLQQILTKLGLGLGYTL